MKERFNSYVDRVGELSRALGSAQKATEVLPGFLGADGPRDYLLVFQNNAEIRTTGGLPGSWAEVHAEDGRLEIDPTGHRQRVPAAGHPDPAAERRESSQVYSDLLGVYFQDANFSTDFPRAAQLLRRGGRRSTPTGSTA